MQINIKRTLKIISLILTICLVFLIFIAYFYYLDLKKTFIEKISDKSTAFIGQRVDIGDLSFSPSAGINIFDISIRNPQGFDSGQLLRIKRLYLKMKFSELFKERFHFKNITVYSPELTLMKDKNGRLNVSDKLLQLFKRKTTIKYQIDEFDIDSGIFDFNNDKRYRNDNINIHLKNLSTDPGTKTLINGHTSCAGENKIKIAGWAYLKDESKKFNVSLTSEKFSLSPFRDFFNKYELNTEKTNINMTFNAEGDTEKGIQFGLEFRIKGVQANFLKKDIQDLRLDMKGTFNINDDSIMVSKFQFYSDEVDNLFLSALITDIRKNPACKIDLKINKIDLSVLNVAPDVKTGGIIHSEDVQVVGDFKNKVLKMSGNVYCKDISVKAQKIPSVTAGNMKSSFKGTLDASGYHGNVLVEAKGISVTKINSEQNILKQAFLNSKLIFRGNYFEFIADTGAGKTSAKISGNVKNFMKKDRNITLNAIVPETKLTDIRESFWDIVLDNLLYAGIEGSLSSNVSIDYSNSNSKINGEVLLRDVTVEGENGEYSLRQVNGTIPIEYDMSSSERSDSVNLDSNYSEEVPDQGDRKITIESFSYGFKLLDKITIWINKKNRAFNIKHFNGNIFGGTLNGSAVVSLSDGFNYRAHINLKGMSLTKLCETIETIKGYISGQVDGIIDIKGSGVGASKIIGKADFWTYSSEKEKTKISKEFLKKIGGPSVKAYLGDRKFDKGLMDIYLQNGFVIFKDLEISNRNFIGIKDLSIKVAPQSNRIAIDHLMWSIIEAANRAKQKK
jgi:hypothetical protein